MISQKTAEECSPAVLVMQGLVDLCREVAVLQRQRWKEFAVKIISKVIAALPLLVRLRQHSLSCMRKQIDIDLLDYFFRNICVSNAAFLSCQIRKCC